VLEDEKLATLIAFSPLAIYYISWDLSFHYTHSVLLAASLCFTFVALLRLERRNHFSSYLILGAAIGIGLLSKYNYALFLAALLPAALADRALRSRLADTRTLLSAVIAVALALPHYLWLWSEREWLSLLARDRFMPKADSGIEIGGLIETGNAVLSFLLPLIVILIVLFPRAFLRP
ncbi:MAG: glycosyltransferase family 39 protein, partial [Rhodospirillaceae bacterium]